MDQLLPKTIEDGEALEKSYPSILLDSASGSEITGDTPYVLSDVNAINKVSF